MKNGTNKTKISALKRSARASLRGNWGPVVTMAFLITAVNALLGFLTVRLTASAVNLFGYVIEFLIVAILMIFAAAFASGLTRQTLRLARSQPLVRGDMIYAFRNHCDRFLMAAFLNLLVDIIYTAPLLIGLYADFSSIAARVVLIVWAAAGLVLIIYIHLCWSLSFQLLLDGTSVGVREALVRSYTLMKGNRLRRLGMELSFIGWYLLGALSSGVGFLWIMPYVSAARSAFYLDIIHSSENKGHA